MALTTTTSPATRSTAIEEAAGSVFSLAKALSKYWPLVLSCVILAGGGSLLYSKSLRKVFESTSMVEINPHASQPLGDKAAPVSELGAGFFMDTREYYETQYKIITSNRVLGAVARDLGLASDYDFMGFEKPPAKLPAIEDVVATLRGHVTVEPVKYSRLVLIRVDDTNPKRAQRISDGVADAYIDQNLQNSLTATSDAVVWLNGQLDTVKRDLEGNENALHTFKQHNDLPSTSINEASNMLRLEMQEFETALAHTRTRKEALSARSAELSKVSPDNPDQLPASELLADLFLQSLRTQYQDALRERSSLLAEGKGESHPSVKRATERLTEARDALLHEVKNVQGAVQRDLAIILREEAGDAALFEATRKRAVDLNMKEIEYHRLDRSRDENEKLYGILLERMKEADLARMMKVNNIRVVDSAIEPKGPVRPRVSLNVMIGLFIGLLLGIALAWIREQLDSSLKLPSDIEEKLGMTFLGLLPELSRTDEKRHRSKLKRRETKEGEEAPSPVELVVHERPLSGIAEAARSIRTNLMFMNPDRPHKVVLISSAAPSEGKTTVACSIAIALAQGGQRVCIIDCDLRRPRLHRIFDRVGDSGVTNVLVGEATVDEVAKQTEVENLWSIPAGPTPPNPADVLHSERFRQFIRDVGAKFDRVIIDSPPLVAVTDSAIISTLVDGTIFVVRAFATSKHLSLQGLRSLRDVDAPMIGAVLNAVNLNKHEYNYYHYYYYKRQGYEPTIPGPSQMPPAIVPNATPPN